MSRIILAWEMGSNLGHVSRLLPLGRRLRSRGHEVLAVVRDLDAAAKMLAPAGIPFIQAPRASSMAAPSAQPASYADVLRYSGWADVQQLWALVQAWVNVLRLFAAETLIVDHSPTALLAARCQLISSVAIGTGFELPPMRQPLPSFPGFPGATLENAVSAERLVLENANRVMQAARGRGLRALSDLFQCDRRWMMTFPELDHYEIRPGERYIGPIGEVGEGEHLEWPSGPSQRIFAYLRPDTPNIGVILRALAGSGAAVVCYAPGVPPSEGPEWKVKGSFWRSDRLTFLSLGAAPVSVSPTPRQRPSPLRFCMEFPSSCRRHTWKRNSLLTGLKCSEQESPCEAR
jgi:hypothetical protein